jgi:hypothetical protein
MKYLITENKIYEAMELYLKMYYPTLTEPLHKKIKTGKGNSGYGSGLDDYTYVNIEYVDVDDEPWFGKYDDRHIYSDTKWEVNGKLESMYNIFGEENFEMFVKQYFGFNITDKGNKIHNWILS